VLVWVGIRLAQRHKSAISAFFSKNQELTVLILLAVATVPALYFLMSKRGPPLDKGARVGALRLSDTWGTLEDPDSDCQFNEMNGVLAMVVPGTDHDLACERGKMNSPRAMRVVEGNFTIQVKVEGVFEPRTSVAADRVAYNGAGLLVCLDDRNYLTLDRATYWNGTSKEVYANYEIRMGGRNTRFGRPEDLPLRNIPETWLKIERRGSRFRAYVKQDVGEWRVLGDKIWQVPQALLVGVMARNTASKPFMPSFSEFDLTLDNGGLK
jgi:regulation of enolase protein 1 (concanavalin A-like superfamily)